MKQRIPPTPDKAYERLADACARAEYCTHELREKMRRMGLAATDAEAVLRRLREGRYVDDARFARAFVRQKAEYARWGRRKIAYALALKRIDRATIADALADIDDEKYASTLHTLLAAKARANGPDALTTYDGRTRLFRFAASRGFESDAIAAAIRKLMV